jgi:hypothetical protein
MKIKITAMLHSRTRLNVYTPPPVLGPIRNLSDLTTLNLPHVYQAGRPLQPMQQLPLGAPWGS